VTVPHPVPVPVPHPVGVPVPKPYPIPVPHPVLVPSTFLLGGSEGGVPFGGLADLFSLGRGASVFMAPPDSHGLSTSYGYGWPASDLSHLYQMLPGFEPSSRGYGTNGNAPTAAYSGQGQHQPASVDAVAANVPADSFSYVQTDKAAPPQPTAVLTTSTSPVAPTSPEDSYRHGPGYKA
jgi:hypothetical protein